MGTYKYDCEALSHQINSELSSQAKLFQFENSVFPTVFNGCCLLLWMEILTPVVYTMHDGHTLHNFTLKSAVLPLTGSWIVPKIHIASLCITDHYLTITRAIQLYFSSHV